MRKSLLVFCCVTLLVALLFGCNGVPALAAINNTDINTTLATLEKTTKKATVPNISKTVKKKKVSKNTISFKKYMKNGKFDCVAFALDMGGMYARDCIINVNFLFEEGFFLTISTDSQYEKGRYFIGIGTLDYDEKLLIEDCELTYFAMLDDWGKSIKTHQKVALPSNGLQHLKKLAKYMLKNPDASKKPTKIKGLKGLKWQDASEMD